MKKLALASVIAFLFVAPLVAPQARAQTPFEGTATWSMSIPQLDEERHEMTMNIKGQQLEIEVDLGAQGGIKTIVDHDKKKIYVIMSAMKSGMVMDLPSDSAAKTMTKNVTEIKSTGQKATIAGHPAEEYVVHTAKADVSMWASADFPKDVRDAFSQAMTAQPGQDAAQVSAFRQFAQKGLIPIKIVEKNGDDIAMSMELVKLEKKKLDDSLFVAPKDITFTPMPAGMQGGMN